MEYLKQSRFENTSLRQAFEHSLNTLLPLCATALGDRMDLAKQLSLDSCRHIIFSTAGTRSESESQGAKNVAAHMAGDGPPPDESSSLSERTFLVLAEESKPRHLFLERGWDGIRVPRRGRWR